MAGISVVLVFGGFGAIGLGLDGIFIVQAGFRAFYADGEEAGLDADEALEAPLGRG